MKIDLIIGRKQIMETLQVSNWRSVTRLINEEGCPIGMLGGRWVARKEKLLSWIDERTQGKSEIGCVKLCNSTIIHSFPSDPYAGIRGVKMPRLLEAYASGKSINQSCKIIGVARKTFYNWRNRFERFDMACKSVEEGRVNQFEGAGSE